ncbi:MAG TPA: hypothetical protein VJ552_05895 [Sediminibacterium sp.]|nr:hypothetical protein [Sediminibacterium sp.]
MEATTKRYISNTTYYDRFFPTAKGEDITIKKQALLNDTMKLIPEIVRKTKWQTAALAKELLLGSVEDTCRNIWEFVFGHIQYHKDRPGYEQVRSPARTWADRFSGVDCDCYAVFISTILSNLGIPHLLRITKYYQNTFQHIYPVAVLDNGREIVLDCVTTEFDYEVPYSEKKDYHMELQYLNGLGCRPTAVKRNAYLDYEEDELEGNWEGQASRNGLGLTLLSPKENLTFLPAGDFDPGIVHSFNPQIITTDEPAVYADPQIQFLEPQPAYMPVDPVPTPVIDKAPEISVASDTIPTMMATTAAPVQTEPYEPYKALPPYQYQMQQRTTVQPAAGSYMPFRNTATCTCHWNDEEMGSIFSKIGNAISNVAKQVGNTVAKVANKVVDVAKDVGEKVVDVAKEVVHVVNRILPTSALLRTAFLTAMKLNILNIARRLRWAYVPKDWFVSQGGDESKWDRVNSIKTKIEKIYWQMGGKTDNLREAIISGKGNNVDPINFSEFSGFGFLGNSDAIDPRYLHANMSMREILGPRMFDEEYYRDGAPSPSMGELGEPVTAATIGAIMGILATIAGLLQQLGVLKAPNQAGNPALTNDYMPGLTTAPENNINDPEYVSAYQNATSSIDLSKDLQLPETSDQPSPFLQTATNVLQTATGVVSSLSPLKNLLLNRTASTAATAASSSLIRPAANVSTPATSNTSVFQPSPPATYNPSSVQYASNQVPSVTQNNAVSNTGTEEKKESWFKKNQTLVIVGGVGLVAIGAGIYFMSKKKQHPPQRLNGTPAQRKKRTNRSQKLIHI